MFIVKSLRFIAIIIASGVLLLYSTASQAELLELSDRPLFLETSNVPPNILFLVDDSGSMDWEVLTKDSDHDGRFTGKQPDGSNQGAGNVKHRDNCSFGGNGQTFYGYIYGVEFTTNSYYHRNRDCDVADNRSWRFRNHDFNPLYFNPNKTYEPWAGVDERGRAFPNMSLTQAKDNPYKSNTQTIDLTRHNSNLNSNGSRNTQGNSSGFRYYTWTDRNGNQLFDNGEETEHLIKNADEETKTNFANWFSYHRSREYTAKAAYGYTISALNDVRIGLATLHNHNRVNTKIRVLNPDPKSGNKRALLDNLYSIDSRNGTPLRQAMDKAGKYFECLDNNGLFSDCPVLSSQEGGACQQNFLVAMTDGFYNGSFSIRNGDRNTDIDGPGEWDGGAYADTYRDTLADIAMRYYERDLHRDLEDYVPITPGVDEARHQHVVTYTVAFGVNGTLNHNPPNNEDPFPWPNPYSSNRARKIDDLRHAAYNGRGEFLSVTDPTKLADTLKGAIESIAERTASSASVALNSGAQNGDSKIYQSLYNTGDWTGQLISYEINPDGSVGSQIFDTGSILDTQHWNSNRRIVTYSRNAKKGIPFRWRKLSREMKDILHHTITGTKDNLGVDRLQYIRGRRDKEGAPSYHFRVRKHVLGDLINSAPNFVGIPSSINGIGPDYATFRENYRNRTPLVYVGGNDGMLHAFDAKTGRERFAYIPSAIFNKLSYLTDSAYKHDFYVDGALTTADAYGQFGSGRCNGCWRTILAGGLRSGGQGIFALDVTDPSTFAESDAGAAKFVLWEFTDQDDPDLGYTYSKPSIVKMSSERWAVIFGNGYNNTEEDGFKSETGHAVLFILFLEKGLDGIWTAGSDYIKLDTSVGSVDSPNGLASPAAIDVDGDRDADYIYAGDLKGNLWKFDVRSGNTNAWTTELLYIAKSPTGESQPITVQPQGRRHPNPEEKGVIVYFGTGKYIEPTDHNNNIPKQTFYAIWDKEDENPTPRDRILLKQTLTNHGSSMRISSQNEINWDIHDGWSVNLPTLGERLISRPRLRGLHVLFATYVPSEEACSFGGDSWLLVLNATNGGRPSNSFDLTGDSKINIQDKVSIGSGNEEQKVAVSGQKFTGGRIFTPELLHSNQLEYDHAYAGSSDGDIRKLASKNDDKTGRMAWKQDQ